MCSPRLAAGVRQVRRNNRTGPTDPDANCMAYDYDALSRRSQLTGGNGAITGYDYDLALRHNLGGTSFDATLTLGYTLASQLQTRSTSNSARGWWTAPDRAQTYAVNGLNQYTTLNGR